MERRSGIADRARAASTNIVKVQENISMVMSRRIRGKYYAALAAAQEHIREACAMRESLRWPCCRASPLICWHWRISFGTCREQDKYAASVWRPPKFPWTMTIVLALPFRRGFARPRAAGFDPRRIALRNLCRNRGEPSFRHRHDHAGRQAHLRRGRCESGGPRPRPVATKGCVRAAPLASGWRVATRY